MATTRSHDASDQFLCRLTGFMVLDCTVSDARNAFETFLPPPSLPVTSLIPSLVVAT